MTSAPSATRRDALPSVRLVSAELPRAGRLEPDQAQADVIARVRQPGHGPLLVLAGPGTGKTATIVEAVAQRLEAGTHPDRVLVLTFSRKAAGELRDRIAARVGADAVGATAWTFHAYCYALVGEQGDPASADGAPRPLRLLSGPEQDVMVRDLLLGHAEEGFVGWPRDLLPALTTRGFADEVRSFFARVRALAHDPEDLRPGRPAWQAACTAMVEYLDVLDARGMLDYSELVHRAVTFAESAEGAPWLADRYDLVVVDEYQDTDPAQERLLQALAGQGRDLLVVGDPDQSIYGFRGADLRGIVDFPDRFRTDADEPAPVLALTVCRRSGPVLVDAARSLAVRLPMTGAAFARVGEQHRARTSEGNDDPGTLEVLTFGTPGAQADAIVDLVRRSHLDDGVAWSQIAVLVRSSASLPSLRRALGAAGVPLEVAGDEVPLADDPALAPWLTALRVVADPGRVSPDETRALLLSPVGGADPAMLRRLGRALRDEARAGSGSAPSEVPSSLDLIHDAVLHPEALEAHDLRDAAPARRLGRLIEAARQQVLAGATAHEVLWTLWQQQPWKDEHLRTWGERLERAALLGGPEGRRADRDLDALVALFELASRAEDHEGRGGVGPFLDLISAQQIPADTLAERGLRGEGVRLLTAHRSKGLEWDVVIVPDVQEGAWPDLRRRGSVLEADRLGPDGVLDPMPNAELLAEERRLFYVAATRARRRLVVTAVASVSDDGARPSRFLDELGVEVVSSTDRVRRPLSLVPLVADLRRAAEDPATSSALRARAIAHLSDLAALEHGGRALIPAAHPDAWWGVAERTSSEAPLYPIDEPLRLSGSSLDGLNRCPLQWFLAHEVRAEGAKGTAVSFGSVVHAIADDVARRDERPTDDDLAARLDAVWSALDFEARWQSDRERGQAEAALRRFLAWHDADRGRRLVGTEVPFRLNVIVGGRPVAVRGSMDRVELDRDGRVVVVDLKTMKTAPSGPAIVEHVQLGLYQYAVREGALADHPQTPDVAVPGGAELVQLRIDKGGMPQVQPQPALVEPEDGSGLPWIDGVLADAVDRLDRADFTPDPVSGNCGFCAFRTSCPTQDAGREVVE
jgi:superfamily I DNA/RNA helicase/RecB family exonuclease